MIVDLLFKKHTYGEKYLKRAIHHLKYAPIIIRL
jgi:hypothetical protein